MKYKLLVKEGSYDADNLFILLIEIFKHRFHHLVYNKEWRDWMNDAMYDLIYLITTAVDILFKISIVFLGFIYTYWKD